MNDYEKSVLDKASHMIFEFIEMKTKEDVEDWDCSDLSALADAFESIFKKMSIDSHLASHKQ